MSTHIRATLIALCACAVLVGAHARWAGPKRLHAPLRGPTAACPPLRSHHGDPQAPGRRVLELRGERGSSPERGARSSPAPPPRTADAPRPARRRRRCALNARRPRSGSSTSTRSATSPPSRPPSPQARRRPRSRPPGPAPGASGAPPTPYRPRAAGANANQREDHDFLPAPPSRPAPPSVPAALADPSRPDDPAQGDSPPCPPAPKCTRPCPAAPPPALPGADPSVAALLRRHAPAEEPSASELRLFDPASNDGVDFKARRPKGAARAALALAHEGESPRHFSWMAAGSERSRARTAGVCI